MDINMYTHTSRRLSMTSCLSCHGDFYFFDVGWTTWLLKFLPNFWKFCDDLQYRSGPLTFKSCPPPHPPSPRCPMSSCLLSHTCKGPNHLNNHFPSLHYLQESQNFRNRRYLSIFLPQPTSEKWPLLHHTQHMVIQFLLELQGRVEIH